MVSVSPETSTTAKTFTNGASMDDDFDDAFAEALIGWYEEHPWSDILLHHGWSQTNLRDTCGCPIWTAPGKHASPKSATTHDLGCTLRRDSADPPMHIWTDNPGDELSDYLDKYPKCKGTLSKFQVFAILEYGADFPKAVRAAGLPITKRIKSGGTIIGDAFDAQAYWHAIGADAADDPVIDPDADLSDDELKAELLKPGTADATPLGTPESGLIWNGGGGGGGGNPTDLRLESMVFGSHPALEHIRKYSRLRGPSPWGVLMKTIGEVLYWLPPNVKLPNIFSEDPGELNLIVGFVGSSGRGKGQT
jgi:hypothetical protein